MKTEFMKKAVELAKKGSGFVNPDPLAGAILVKDNKIIAKGFYKHYGGNSAEEEVLKQIKEPIPGSELYLTIEPFRFGSSSIELANRMKLLGVTRVHIGVKDSNPNKRQNFISDLKNMGIEVIVSELAEACEELNEIYSYYIQNKKPFVVVKWAMTLDGKLATWAGDSKWISSEGSLEFVHHLRQRVSAIMVGENTVKMDDPLLTTRLPKGKISNPIRIILSKYGNLPDNAKVLQVDKQTRTLLITSVKISKEKELYFLNRGVDLIKLEERNGHLDFNEIMSALGALGIDSVYMEGGSSVLASAFESGCIHKVYAAVAPKIIGGSAAITPVGGKGIEFMRDAIVLNKVSHEVIGTDVIIKGYI